MTIIKKIYDLEKMKFSNNHLHGKSSIKKEEINEKNNDIDNCDSAIFIIH